MENDDFDLDDIDSLIETIGGPAKSINFDDIEKNYGVTRSFRSPGGGLTALSLWMKTNGARSRDPLFLLPHRKLSVDKPGITLQPFFNMSNTLHVRPDVVLNTKAIDLLTSFVKPGEVLDNEETTMFDSLLRVLPYMRKMTVQERRFGGMINLGIVDGRWSLQLDTLLMLSERNFWIQNKKDRKDLESIISELDDFGAGGVVKTRFGLGDTRLRLGYNLSDTEWVKATLGVEGIIPTSRMGKKRPQAVRKCKIGDERKSLINDLLNISKQLMIEPSLGTGHWGLGGFLDMRLHLVPHKLDFWSRLSFDYLFPGTEYRYMPSTRTIPINKLSLLTSSDTIPEGFPLDDLFPYLTRARVSPGHIFNATIGFDWKMNKNWQLGLGYDFYAQQAEKIKNVRVPDIDPSLLRVDDAIAAQIVQHKVFGELMYNTTGKNCNWQFGVGGDMTFSSQGAARDWTVYGKIGITF